MKERFIERLVISLIVIQLLTVFASQTGGVKGQGGRTLRLLDSNTGLNSIILGNETEPIPGGGWPFGVGVMLDGATSDLATWQVMITFDNNSIRCTTASIPDRDPSYAFYGKSEIPAIDLGSQDFVLPQVVIGATLLDPSQAVTVSNTTLCLLNFTALRQGNFTVSLVPKEAGNVEATFLLDSNGVDIPYTNASLSVRVLVGAGTSKPAAVFKYSPENPKANQTVTFDASRSYDPTGEPITSYNWDFGDNTTASGKILTHGYLNGGLYTVNLTVTNADNVTASTIQQVQVGSIPTAKFTYSPVAILPEREVTFNASESTVPNGTIISYLWDFRDNTTLTTNGTIVTHTYSARGVYDVNLTVTDSDGLLNSTTLELKVGTPPVPLFIWNPETISIGDEVTFEASATSDTGVSITSYTWDFGLFLIGEQEHSVDTVQTNSSIITHVFPSADVWDIRLTVYDSDGLHASYDQNVTVINTVVEKGASFTPQIVIVAIVVLIVIALVVRRVRRKEEEALEI